EDLVAVVDDGSVCLEDGLLATVGDDDVGRVDLIAGITQRLGGNRLPQLRQTRRRRVAVVLGIACGGDRGLDDEVRRGEVRLACTEADDGASGRLEGLRLGIDRPRGGGRNGAEAGGDAASGSSHKGHSSIPRMARFPRRPGSSPSPAGGTRRSDLTRFTLAGRVLIVDDKTSTVDKGA